MRLPRDTEVLADLLGELLEHLDLYVVQEDNEKAYTIGSVYHLNTEKSAINGLAQRLGDLAIVLTKSKEAKKETASKRGRGSG